MSTFESDDLGTTGYFLPEDSQFRLKKLREYVEFLSHLAQPRRPDEEREGVPEIRPGEVAICLELLEEQIAQVLGELSWPAERRDGTAASEAKAEFEAEPKVAAAAEAADKDDAESELAGSTTNEAGERYVSGITLDQIDELARLGDILRAHGDVVVATDQADFADVTLSIMGDAILRDAERLRDIIHDIDSVQRLDGRRRSHADVREEAATYLAVPACASLRGMARPSARLTVVGPLGGGERAAALAYAQPAL
ncbi:XAC0095 family protein [Rhodanobacter umsongensis]|uniref:XAC0095 family protein n=1 Tax=Rhodanobacter umsongensis TaxID=633153 RepID=A0ABW0JHT4_9GAMM